MAMLPIFLIGLFIGVLFTLAFSAYRKETPSDVKVNVMEANIVALKEDIKLLEETNEKLRKELSEVKENK